MQSTTLWDEATAAARGTWALLRGNRSAPSAFDFSLRGLTGSLIALVMILAVNAVLGSIGAANSPRLAAVIFIAVLIYAIEAGFAALVLNYMQRLDGFVPHLVADIWSHALLGIIATIGIVAGLNDLVVLVVGLASLIVKINIARLIVTLRPGQVAIFVIAQLVGSFVGVIIALLFLPPPPDMVLPV